jgi:2-iminoacetate synthase
MQIDEIVAEARLGKGLSLEQVAALINVTSPTDLEAIYETASYLKNSIYGKRVVLFAPLYVSNYCTNNCLYCGFRIGNHDIQRVALTTEQIQQEVIEILNQGHKRILMLMGEHPKKSSLSHFIDAIETAYATRNSKGSNIRRINVEIEPLTNEEFQTIKDVPIGTYTVFQETYHKPTYEKVHLAGKKMDYNWRLEVMHRALANGLHDVGIGALFGLYDYRYEVLGLLSHAISLENEFGVGPHTISIPRLQYAQNAPYSEGTKYMVSDADFKKLVAVLRLAVPYTGMILSTRESATMRMDLLNIGISQISSGSRTNPGGYKQAFTEQADGSQFSMNDGRSSGEVIGSLIDSGFIPSFCTSCYRVGRVGAKFMQIAKPGDIKTFCQPNALLTLKEYVDDYCNEDLQHKYNAMLQNELEALPAQEQKIATKLFDRIKAGERDLYL